MPKYKAKELIHSCRQAMRLPVRRAALIREIQQELQELIKLVADTLEPEESIAKLDPPEYIIRDVAREVGHAF